MAMLDILWMNHLENLEALRESVGMRAYGQHDPLVEYRRESFMMFKEMMGNFDKWLEENKEKLEQLTIDKEQLTSRTANNSVKGQMSVVSGQKVGRNDPCPCGAKKEDGRPIKYKHCHGRNV